MTVERPTWPDGRSGAGKGRYPEWVWNVEGAKLAHLRMYAVLDSMCGGAGGPHTCWPKQARIAARYGLTGKHAAYHAGRIIREMASMGLVQPEDRFNEHGDQIASMYTLAREAPHVFPDRAQTTRDDARDQRATPRADRAEQEARRIDPSALTPPQNAFTGPTTPSAPSAVGAWMTERDKFANAAIATLEASNATASVVAIEDALRQRWPAMSDVAADCWAATHITIDWWLRRVGNELTQSIVIDSLNATASAIAAGAGKRPSYVGMRLSSDIADAVLPGYDGREFHDAVMADITWFFQAPRRDTA